MGGATRRIAQGLQSSGRKGESCCPAQPCNTSEPDRGQGLARTQSQLRSGSRQIPSSPAPPTSCTSLWPARSGAGDQQVCETNGKQAGQAKPLQNASVWVSVLTRKDKIQSAEGQNFPDPQLRGRQWLYPRRKRSQDSRVPVPSLSFLVCLI